MDGVALLGSSESQVKHILKTMALVYKNSPDVTPFGILLDKCEALGILTYCPLGNITVIYL